MVLHSWHKNSLLLSSHCSSCSSRLNGMQLQVLPPICHQLLSGNDTTRT
uniref:Uncharacterized protein n=1 Tax=Brugia timori TaxID=42155 RepID=A0A0R3QIU0_9BILA